MADPLLDQLRAVFLDELSEQLGFLERALVTLVRKDAGADVRRAAALDVRRAAHTLKGAARAVSYADVERLCHGLESALADVRAEGAEVDADAVLAATRPVVEELHRFARERAPAPPATDEIPEGLPVSPAAATSLDTVRVTVAKVLDISNASEELVVAALQGDSFTADEARFEETLTSLRGHLQGLAEGRGSLELSAANAALQSLAHWGLEQRRKRHAVWRDLRLHARRVSRLTRGLRATRFEELRPTLERSALETARDVGKEVRFELHGAELELDRRVVDRLREPLVHLLRNAVDHGLEPPAQRRDRGKPSAGCVRVSARALNTDVVVTLEDDGHGIDLEAVARAADERGLHADDEHGLLDLLFEPGFTTRGLTTRTSGRGIGLDVVRQRVASMQGRVAISTDRGRGTCFTLTVPADLSVVRGQVVSVRGRPFVLVESAVERGVRVHPNDERLVEGRRYLAERDGLTPLADLGVTLGLRGAPASGPRPAVVLAAGDRRMAYLVDELAGSVEVVIKPLGPRVRRAGVVNGATMLERGEVACVLDAFLLVQQGRAQRQRLVGQAGDTPRRRVLVVDDSVTTRQLLASLLESAGYRVDTAVDGEAAWRLLQQPPLPDIVVSDIEMPRVDGFQLLARMRASPHLSRLPVVMVTALVSDSDRRRALDLGADAYVVKSRFDQQALIDTLEELLP